MGEQYRNVCILFEKSKKQQVFAVKHSQVNSLFRFIAYSNETRAGTDVLLHSQQNCYFQWFHEEQLVSKYIFSHDKVLIGSSRFTKEHIETYIFASV